MYWQIRQRQSIRPIVKFFGTSSLWSTWYMYLYQATNWSWSGSWLKLFQSASNIVNVTMLRPRITNRCQTVWVCSSLMRMTRLVCDSVKCSGGISISRKSFQSFKAPRDLSSSGEGQERVVKHTRRPRWFQYCGRTEWNWQFLLLEIVSY